MLKCYVGMWPVTDLIKQRLHATSTGARKKAVGVKNKILGATEGDTSLDSISTRSKKKRV
jgi:hypothetical protein